MMTGGLFRTELLAKHFKLFNNIPLIHIFVFDYGKTFLSFSLLNADYLSNLTAVKSAFATIPDGIAITLKPHIPMRKAKSFPPKVIG